MQYRKYSSGGAIDTPKRSNITINHFLLGKSTRLLRSLPDRVLFYLQALLKDLELPASEGQYPNIDRSIRRADVPVYRWKAIHLFQWSIDLSAFQYARCA